MNNRSNNSGYRHVSSNDGQDWVVNKECCKIEEEITDVKQIYGFTIRLSECMKAGATCFRDFEDHKNAKLWEKIFQSFLMLGECIAARLIDLVKNNGGDIGNQELVQFFVEPVLDRDKYYEDLSTPYCKTSAVAYTFWILVRDNNGIERLFDIPKMFEHITDIAIRYCRKRNGGNNDALKQVEQMYNFMRDDMDDDEGRPRERKRSRGDKEIPLPKHERWKLIDTKEVFASLFDLMMHNEEWQTDRLNELTQRASRARDNPASANSIFSPAVALYARQNKCLRNQQVYNWDYIFRWNQERANFSVKFPMLKYVLKIPPSMFKVESIINRKLPLYQLNSTYSVTKMLPVLVDTIESVIEEEISEQEFRKNKTLIPKNRSIWESEFHGYNKVLNHILNSDHLESDSPTDSIDGSSDSDDPDQDEDLHNFNIQAKKLALSSNFVPTQDRNDMVRNILDEQRKKRMEQENMLRSNHAISKIKTMFDRFNMSHIFKKVVTERLGNINRLMPSQLTNCTTVWPEGTDTRDNSQDDHYEFISIYAILEAQAVCGRKAIKNIIQRIQNNEIGVERINNPNEVIRKLTLLLKKHMLKEYITKCMNEDAYGLSPYEKPILRYGRTKNPFGMKITHTKFDQSLGLFSNMECINYIKINSLLHISDVILRPLSLALKYSMDSLRLEYDLHLNMILFDVKKGGTGKSEVEKQVIECSIEHSVRVEAYKSTRSDITSQRNMNSGTKFWPELQPSLINDADPKNEQARMLKENTTSGVATGTRLKKNDDGTFEQEFIRSENIGSIIGNSNANLYGLTGPIKSRFHLVHVEEHQNPYRDILHVKTEEKVSGEDASMQQQAFKDENKFMQYMLFHIERLFKCGVLDPPTMDIAWIFMLVLQRTLSARGISLRNVRVPSSLVTLARQNLLREAIERNWLHRGAKYNGKTITMEQFLDLDPMLFVTPEHILAAIGEAADRIIEPATDSVRRCIREYWIELSGKPRFKGKKKKNIIHIPSNEGDQSRNFNLDYNWMRFGIPNGPKDLYKKLSQMSYKFGGMVVSPESVENVIVGWVDCRTEAPYYAYLGDANLDGKMDEDQRPLEASLDEIRIDTRQPKKIQSLVDINAKSIYFLWHHFKEENPKSGMTELKEAVISILSCAHQLDNRFIFDTNSKFPFIREIIEVNEKSRRDNHDVLITFPSLNLVKSEMKKILKTTSYHSMVRDESTEDMDSTDCDVTAIGSELATYSLRKRLEKLYITEKPINGDYATFNLFSGMVKKIKDISGMTTVEKESLCFYDNTDYNRHGNGYFMGEELDHITKAENIFDPTEMAINLKKFYTILDRVEEGDSIVSLKDDDFDPEAYVVQEYMTMSGEVQKKYHWEYYDTPHLSNPRFYKLMRHHPKVANDFFNLKNESLNIGSGVYPTEIIKEYKDSVRIRPEIMLNSRLTNAKLPEMMQQKQIRVDNYGVKTVGGKPSILKSDNLPLNDIELFYSSKTYKKIPTGNLGSKVIQAHSQKRNLKVHFNEDIERPLAKKIIRKKKKQKFDE